MIRSRRPATPALPGLLGLAVLAAAPAQATITGVCPDGSMFIVKKEADIPCRGAKQVEPQDVPPIRPHYLPRPYAWELHQQQQDPNNPYNLVEDADRQRSGGQDGADAPQPLEATEPAPRPAPPQAGAGGAGSGAPQAVARPPARPLPAVAAPPAAEPLVLAPEEVRDLGLIVELTQDRIPARFARGEPPTLTLDLAHSRAFEARVDDTYRDAALGPVVLFRATALGPEEFHANLTFVQGHQAYTPVRQDPRSFGLLDGRLGPQPAGGVVLGYVVLPEGLDLRAPLDVYWNDRRISVVLRP